MARTLLAALRPVNRLVAARSLVNPSAHHGARVGHRANPRHQARAGRRAHLRDQASLVVHKATRVGHRANPRHQANPADLGHRSARHAGLTTVHPPVHLRERTDHLGVTSLRPPGHPRVPPAVAQVADLRAHRVPDNLPLNALPAVGHRPPHRHTRANRVNQAAAPWDPTASPHGDPAADLPDPQANQDVRAAALSDLTANHHAAPAAAPWDP